MGYLDGNGVTYLWRKIKSAIAQGTAADAGKLGGKNPAYYLPARNLLDNSYFLRPINQRGRSAYKSDGLIYTIDRWELSTTGVGVDSNIELTEQGAVYYIALAGKYAQFTQLLESPQLYYGKTLTFAMYLQDEPAAGVVLLINTETEQSQVEMHAGLNIVTHTVQDGAANIYFRVQNNNLTEAGAIHPVWAAAYEGAYTAETLPPYIPKGYAEELTACQRFYERVHSHIFFSDAGEVDYVIHYGNKRISAPTVTLGDTTFMSAIDVAFAAFNAAINDASGKIGVATGKGYWYGYFDVSADL